MLLRQRWSLPVVVAVTAWSAVACSSGGGSADDTLPPIRTTVPGAPATIAVPTPSATLPVSSSTDGEVAVLPPTSVPLTLPPTTLPPTLPPSTIPASTTLSPPTTVPPSTTLPSPTTLPPSTTAAATATTASGTAPTTYRILTGDTLYGIARAFTTTLDQLLAANDLSIDDTIQEGDVLTLPKDARPITADDVKTRRYKVKAGDTILSIARANDVIPAQLLALNRKLDTPDQLAVGEVLLIPRFPDDA